MNDRQVEALADELAYIRKHRAIETVHAVDARLAAIELALRTRTPSAPDVAMREALESIAHAESMLSEHIEKYHDGDFEPHAELAERASLRDVQHHLAGSLIGNDGEPIKIPEIDFPLNKVAINAFRAGFNNQLRERKRKRFSGELLIPAEEVGLRAMLRALSALEAKAGEPDCLKPPFEIYHDKTDIGDANGHVCTAENPEIALALIARLNATPAVDREAMARTHKAIVDAHAAITSLPIDALGWASTDDVEWPIRDELADKLDDACKAILSLFAPTAPAQEGE